MQTLSEHAVIDCIERGETFEAVLEDGSMQIRVLDYVPYLCTAVHAGNQLRTDLISNCRLGSVQRYLEEDPYTGDLIDSFPITLVGCDSRYEYDLNRAPDLCVYESAWGEDVWKQPLSDEQKVMSLAKHHCYYRIMAVLLGKLGSRFGSCLVFDIHSYNHKTREYDQPPVFNLGSYQIDMRRWSKLVYSFEKKLAAINIPNEKTTVAIDKVFQGRGYQASFIKKNFPKFLTIPLEIKKIYMDERTGEVFPIVLERLHSGIHRAVIDTAAAFNHKLGGNRLNRLSMLPANLDPLVVQVDNALYKLARGIETLNYVNPINLQQEKRRFFSRRGYEPIFQYRQLRIDPYDFREKLYKLPVSQISEPRLRNLYRSVVDSYATKIELLTHIGTPQFYYNSLRNYGEPTSSDIDNARFLLYSTELPEFKDSPCDIKPEEALKEFQDTAKEWGMSCLVKLSNRLVAKAMVNNTLRTLLVNRNSLYSRIDLEALKHHELGIHMATTLNALDQPLKVLQLGLPGSTYTQEGLAILAEYLSGNMNLARLKQLALRVLAVEMMVNGMSFNSVFNQLCSDHGLDNDSAFSLTTRVFRGGGFTKDYLYLRGFRDLLALAKTEDLTALMLGKTSISHLETLRELIERKILTPPVLVPSLLSQEVTSHNPTLDYLVTCIK